MDYLDWYLAVGFLYAVWSVGLSVWFYQDKITELYSALVVRVGSIAPYVAYIVFILAFVICALAWPIFLVKGIYTAVTKKA